MKNLCLLLLIGIACPAFSGAQTFLCKPIHKYFCSSKGCLPDEQGGVPDEQYSVIYQSRKLEACIGSGCFSGILQTMHPGGANWIGTGIVRQQNAIDRPNIPPMVITIALDRHALLFSASWGEDADSVTFVSGGCTISNQRTGKKAQE